MPHLLITEHTSKHTRVFVAQSPNSLSAEIIDRLKNHPGFEIVSDIKATSIDIIIYLSGNAPPSLGETLSHTSHLHRTLEHVAQNRIKFIMVLPQNKTALQETAASLVTQFGHNFRIDYRVVEIPSGINTTAAATEIIRVFFPSYSPITKQISVSSPAPVSKKPSKTIPILTVSITFILLLLSYPLTLYSLLRCSSSQFMNGNFSTSTSCAKLSLSLSRIVPTVSPYQLAARQLSETLILANQLAGRSLPYLKTFLGSGQTSPSDISDLSLTLTRLTDSLGFLQATLQPLPRLKPLLLRISSARSMAQKISPLISSLPDLISINSKSTVLLLLQDPTELRATGGFLSHFALLTLENGRLTNIQIYNTDSTDSQLRGHVFPPQDLTRAIGESSWFLRDANWDPDFPSSSSRASWFVNKELSLSSDRVASVHLGTLIELLSLTGPLRLPESNLTVTRQNFYTQYLAHPDILSEFYQSLFDKLRTLGPNQAFQALGLIINSLESRQTFISSTVWDGGVALPSCRSSLPCLSHYFYPVSSNVGINKTNSFIQTQAQLGIQITPDQTMFDYQANFVHTSSQTNWPAGHYKNYLRLYLPPQSKPEAVLINGQSAPTYYVTSEHGLVVLGVLIDTPPATTSKIAVTWRQPAVLSSRFHYQIDIPNQSGQSPLPLAVTITYPPKWFATANAPALASPGQLQYNQPLSRLLRIDIDFAQNGN